MRVLHVTTLLTPDGAYGGPVRVALNQAVALRARGHTVELAAAFEGYKDPPVEMNGVLIHAFRARRLSSRLGFAGVAAPRLWWWLRRRATQYDVVHIHLARDLVTLPSALMLPRGIRLVLQTHGMVDPSSNYLARVFDPVLTRPTLRRASTVLFLTPGEESDLQAVAGPAIRLTQLPNGVPIATTAALEPSEVEVLYLGRLHARKQPTTFVRAASQLHQRFPDVRFALVGPDEGEAEAVRRLIDQLGMANYCTWEGAIPPEATLNRLARSSIYVLPAVDEPFPMSVLEAMSVGVPVVLTNTCGLAPAVARSGSGLITDASLGEVRNAIARLLSAPELRREMGKRALELAVHDFSMAQIAARLEHVYSSRAHSLSN